MPLDNLFKNLMKNAAFVRILQKNLAMGKPLKMIEGMIVTDSFWS